MKPITIILVLLLVGCSTPSYKPDWQNKTILQFSSEVGVTYACHLKGFIDKNTYKAFKDLTYQYLSLGNYKYDVFIEQYEIAFQDGLKQDIKEQCLKWNKVIPTRLRQLSKNYKVELNKQQKLKEDYNRALANLSKQMEDFADNKPTVSMPTNEPSNSVQFGTPSPSYDSVLINTDGGTVQCYRTSGGYIFCN